MQALREQVFVAPRYVSQPPSSLPLRSSPTRTPRANVSQSRVLSALAVMNMGASTASSTAATVEPRPAHPFLFPHNAGREQPPGVCPAFPPSSRGAASLTPPVMETPPVPPPARRAIKHARLASALSSEIDGTISVADTKESDPSPEGAPVKEPAPTKPSYSYKDYTPEPIMVYTRSVDEVNDHIPLLRGPLGFDMEWKVLYRRQVACRPTAVVQICDEKYIWVIQVSVMRKCFPFALKRILENPDVPKIGVNIINDAKKLYKDFGIRMQNLVELSYMSRQADKTLRLGGRLHARTRISLQKLVGEYLDKHLLKDEARLSDWESKLSNKQLQYAANDAHCGLQLYKRFHTMAKDGRVKLTPDWYTLRIREDGECVFKEEPPAPVGATTKKIAAKAKDSGTSQVPEESMPLTEQATLTEQVTEIGKPKPVKRKASPHARSSRPLKPSALPSSSESSRSSASSWPPRRRIRARKNPEPAIVEITDSDISSDESAVAETQAASTQLLRAGPSRQSLVPPRTAVVDHPPPGEVAFSGRGLHRVDRSDNHIERESNQRSSDKDPRSSGRQLNED